MTVRNFEQEADRFVFAELFFSGGRGKNIGAAQNIIGRGFIEIGKSV